MFEGKLIEPAVRRRGRRIQQWRIALAQCHDLRVVVEEGEKLAIAPHATRIECAVAHAPVAKETPQRCDVKR